MKRAAQVLWIAVKVALVVQFGTAVAEFVYRGF